MIWQDLVFLGGNAVLFVALLPMLLGPIRPPVRSSLTTAAVLWAYAFAFVTLGLLPSAAATALTAASWSVLALQGWRAARRSDEMHRAVVERLVSAGEAAD